MRFLLMPLFATALLAQTPPAFEVASVKPDPWPARNMRFGISLKNDTLTASHCDLYSLVSYAYNLREGHLSGGPPWAKHGMLDSSELYFVLAKASGDPPPPIEQFRLMLQTLLAERFHLEVHHVPKEFPTYNLVVSAHGLKMKESAPNADSRLNQDARINKGHAIRAKATHITMAQFVDQLALYSGRPVFDHTGLTGAYDFELSWDSDDAQSLAPDAIGQDFVTAVEKQLGLKLEPSSGPFDTVVIDRAEKPTAN